MFFSQVSLCYVFSTFLRIKILDPLWYFYPSWPCAVTLTSGFPGAVPLPALTSGFSWRCSSAHTEFWVSLLLSCEAVSCAFASPSVKWSLPEVTPATHVLPLLWNEFALSLLLHSDIHVAFQFSCVLSVLFH